MVLDVHQYNDLVSGVNDRTLSFARHDLRYRWPNREMPLEFDDNTIPKGSNNRNFLEGSISEMNKELCGCFRFR